MPAVYILEIINWMSLFEYDFAEFLSSLKGITQSGFNTPESLP
jgi:hypothetical protein